MIANLRGIRSIYMFEMARFGRTFWTSLMLPVITTTLYFIVFGSAIGSRMSEVSAVPYGLFIVPGLMMLTMFTESISNASFGIYMPKWTGTIYEMTFCLFGFIIGIWAQSFEQLQVIPMLVVYPLTFLGGAFYSLDMLPKAWQTVTLFNPVVYLISGFRWTFFGAGDVGIGVSMGAVTLFLAICLAIVFWMFRTGYRLKN